MAKFPRLPGTLAIALALVAGCGPAGVTKLVATPRPSSGTGVTPAASVTPKAPASTADPSPAVVAHGGRVLGQDGKPAAGIQVTATLISQDGGGIVAQGGGNIVAQGGGNLRLLAADAPITTTTDADGRFSLALPAGSRANIEAVKSDDLKAIALGAASLDDLTLKLDFTGSISGKVSAPGNAAATDFEGLDVFIPGTSYAAHAAHDGSFTIDHVPVGSFRLVARKTGLGEAAADGVTVTPHGTTQAPPLALVLKTPDISSVTPDNAAPGATVTLAGVNFGASTGATVGVTLGGVGIDGVQRNTDGTLSFKVPDNAASGDLVVKVDGVPGKAGHLAVIKSLALAHRVEDLHPGDHLALSLVATDTAGTAIAHPAVTWVSSSKAASVDATGNVTAASEGATWVTASSGTLSATVDVGVFKTAPSTTRVGGDDNNSLSGLAIDANGLATASSFLGGGLFQLDTKQPAGKYAAVVGPMSQLPPVDGVLARATAGRVSRLVNAADGTLYFADSNRIRMVKDGAVTTIAGSNAVGASDGAGTAAGFGSIADLALDGAGHLYVADGSGASVRVVDLVGPSHGVTTLGAKVGVPGALAIDGRTLYVATTTGRCIEKVSLDTGTVTPFSGDCADTATPKPAASGAVPELAGYSVLAVGPGGRLVAGGGSSLYAISADGAAHYLVGDGTYGFQDGERKDVRLEDVCGLVFDAHGTLWCAMHDDEAAGSYRLITIDPGSMP